MYTILSARIANAEGTAVVLRTSEVADVVISLRDTPEAWEDYQKWLQAGGIPSAYQPITRVRAVERVDLVGQKLVEKGVLTQVEWDAISGVDERATTPRG